MSLLRESGPDDQQLVRYLLRLLPEDEADRLDEMSISDDGLAWRLREVENDLVDAYVRGALTGETLQRFESSYLSSERRREKVRFAGSFLGALNRQAAGPADQSCADSLSSSESAMSKSSHEYSEPAGTASKVRYRKSPRVVAHVVKTA